MVALASLRLEGRLVSKHIVVGAAVAGTSIAHSEHPFTGTDRGGVSGPVTVVSGNLDGGSPDFAIILLNTRGVDASDLLFSSPAAAQSAQAAGAPLHLSDYYFA